MNRTLLEILGVLALAVLLVSLYGQLDVLRERTADVAELRETVARATEAAADDKPSREEMEALRSTLLSDLDRRLSDIDRRLSDASQTAEEACTLRAELRSVEQRTALFRAEVERDVSRAYEIVDNYQSELRAKADRVGATALDNASRLAELQRTVLRDARELTERMILPTIQLNGEDTVGSGTLILSGPDPRIEGSDGEVVNYVITSYHVVRNIFADTPKAKKDGVEVTIYSVADDGGNDTFKADMVAFDARIDAALLKLRTDRVFPRVATVLTREEARNVKVWDPIFAIGCPLGNDPIPTRGELSSVHNELGGANYWMLNAPTYYGNSGGGVYTGDDQLALLGVFSKIYTHGRTTPVVVPHMGLCTPILEIYQWLDGEDLSWVLEGSAAARPSNLGEFAASPPK